MTGIVYFPDAENPELTGRMLFQLAGQINSEWDLRNLATVGLAMEHKTVDKHLKNKDKEINEAVLGVLKEWWRGQDNPKTAYRKLCEALRHRDVNMRSYIVETLK